MPLYLIGIFAWGLLLVLAICIVSVNPPEAQ